MAQTPMTEAATAPTELSGTDLDDANGGIIAILIDKTPRQAFSSNRA